MSLSDVGSIASILGLVLAIVFGFAAACKFVINKSKNIGRDDKSINIGAKAKVENSFNNEKTFIKKGK